MKIVADENMAALMPLFASLGTVNSLPGRQINAATVAADTEVLLLRSVTKVNRELIEALPQLKFVGTATIGTDHLDIEALEQRGIRWSNAPGCNAQGVGEYVLSALLTLAEQDQQSLRDKTIGIVGLGNTGSAVERRLRALGCTILCCDPPRQQRGDAGSWYSLPHLLSHCDVITLHIPLRADTHHLLDYQQLQQLPANCWLINASRGEVVNNRDLIKLKQQRPQMRLALDVWEQEPNPIAELVELAEIATPHIAGYSVEGKIRGSWMLHQAWLGEQRPRPSVAELLDVEPLPVRTITAPLSQAELQQLTAAVYDVMTEDMLFRSALPQGFDARRKANLARREFSAQPIVCAHRDTQTMLAELGFTVQENSNHGL